MASLRLKFGALIAFLLPAIAGAVEMHHDTPAYWSRSGWTVYSYPEEEMCEAATNTNNGEKFTLGSGPVKLLARCVEC